MDRREFFKKSLAVGAAVGAAAVLGNKEALFAAGKELKDKPVSVLPYDLVAVKNAGPAALFDAAIKAMGGMKQFVKKGQTVVIKPNIGWNVAPELAANTNPLLVKRVIEHCLEAGAKKVYVFDHTCDNWASSYKNSGIEAMVREAGGTMAPGHSESHYQAVDIPDGKKLTNAKVHELLLENSVFINIPILKNHSAANMTMAMKNLMGIVWDRWYWHSNNLHQCIADMPLWRKPDLNILDAYAVMRTNGPRGTSAKDVEIHKTLVMSPDIVAVDAAGALLFGRKPDKVNYIKLAADAGIGQLNLENLKIQRITL